ncbi:DeoR/GlpR family DNA-binding transcription regulator [Staphylococcus haemolyticus]|uniref:DeoR/GlpR family DNA-binding transcription regulator n=1 Tax=Staphylococcus haemolyticus TaxID=1283 RepID=UPI001F0B0349|nr:DeoR/GlpR family DNA-binding transcription regulator [Staphylococcus haemolyticus]MCH4458075.1 DeoR/GlpR family DNA-binding transcription regulator [Staphylococcus haemolyticus]MCH4490738.1 DeoR/GlpR family DNA-binding transcription regulator [Staphylococcus haemolyticus]MDU0435334.1 DeoR/GlpR family DNA-binding transcription regulator [Staphylococcus haemolyticus]
MKKFQRYQNIINMLTSYKQVEVKSLAIKFEVTEETIRRDLEYLETQGVLTRTHGGAIIKNNNDLPYRYRSTNNLDFKKIIAEKTIPLIKDFNTLMVDSSSTALEVIRLLSSKNLTPDIITNSINLLYEFSDTNINFISTGGTLSKHSGTLVGAQAIEVLKNYFTNAVLLSCNSMTLDGFSVGGEEEGLTKKKMLQQGNIVLMLVDSSKFCIDKPSFFKFADFSQIDYLITDKKDIPNKFLKILKDNNVEIIN